MNKKLILAIIAAIALIAVFLIFTQKEVTNFEECIATGSPAMESHPRQCIYGDRTFIEYISMDPDECLDRGGRVLNTLPDYECYANETNIGEVVGLLCPCVCCVPK